MARLHSDGTMRLPFLLLLVLLSTASAEDFLIQGATVVDGTGAPARRASVLVLDARIAAVGESIAVPSGIAVIEAGGTTLVPGLFDLHTHLLASAVTGVPADWGKILKAYLYCGVTSVVDLSTFTEQFEPMRRLAKTLPSPRLHLASRFSSPGGHGLEGGRGDFHTQDPLTAAQARAAVRRVLPFRPDVLKVFTDGWRYGVGTDMTSMDEVTLAALVEESHRAGVKVLTHTVTVKKAEEAARAGVDIIVHGLGDRRAEASLWSLIKEKRTGYVQTLSVYEPGRSVSQSDELLRAALGPAVFERLRPPQRSPEAARLVRWANLLENGRAAEDAGVFVGAGTDAGMPGTYHGWATLHELGLLVQTGMTPLEAIRAATSTSARLLGVDKDRGTIEAGKLADLVLVAGSPQEDIADIMKVSRVWLGGKEVDRQALAAAIASPQPTPLTAVKPPTLLDDFSRTDFRSRLDTLWINNTDGGHDHAEMIYVRSERRPGDGTLLVTAKMTDKERPYGTMILPFAKGGIEPADLSGYRGVQFDVRGNGEPQLALRSRGARQAQTRPFQPASGWRTIRIAFDPQWDVRQVLSLEFTTSAKPGTRLWLELDNLRLYR